MVSGIQPWAIIPWRFSPAARYFKMDGGKKGGIFPCFLFPFIGVPS
jgi:hypothetical protein